MMMPRRLPTMTPAAIISLMPSRHDERRRCDASLQMPLFYAAELLSCCHERLRFLPLFFFIIFEPLCRHRLRFRAFVTLLMPIFHAADDMLLADCRYDIYAD
jgi:hypothetical protein